MSENEIAVGIDLGTTNSCAAYVNSNNQIEIINNAEGFRTTPSVFAIKDSEIIIGKTACDQEAKNAKNTIRSVKRWMGTNHRFEIDSKSWSPEEISCEILKKIKKERGEATKTEGEFSVNNLVFKVLRNKKVFDIIKDDKKEIVNNVFSINSN